MPEDIAKQDQMQHFWCPLLGQTMTFGYCRRMADGLPCHRVLICFESHFPVQQFLDYHFDAATQARFLAAPKGRMERVVETLDKTGKLPGGGGDA